MQNCFHFLFKLCMSTGQLYHKRLATSLFLALWSDNQSFVKGYKMHKYHGVAQLSFSSRVLKLGQLYDIFCKETP